MKRLILLIFVFFAVGLRAETQPVATEAVLLTAVSKTQFALTHEQPQPVLLGVPELPQLLGMGSTELLDCFSFGVAFEDLDSHRIHINLFQLDCREPAGNRLVTPIKAWVVDAENQRGLDNQQDDTSSDMSLIPKHQHLRVVFNVPEAIAWNPASKKPN